MIIVNGSGRFRLEFLRLIESDYVTKNYLVIPIRYDYYYVCQVSLLMIAVASEVLV
jgi:hypothetical protein